MSRIDKLMPDFGARMMLLGLRTVTEEKKELLKNPRFKNSSVLEAELLNLCHLVEHFYDYIVNEPATNTET